MIQNEFIKFYHFKLYFIILNFIILNYTFRPGCAVLIRNQAGGNFDTYFKLVDIPNCQKIQCKQHLAFVIVFFTPLKEEPQK